MLWAFGSTGDGQTVTQRAWYTEPSLKEPLMDEGNHPTPGIGLFLSGILLTIVFLGIWWWYWWSIWPPDLSGVISAAVGLWLGSIYCVYRTHQWDTRTWRRHDGRAATDQRRTRLVFIVAPLSVGLGWAARIILGDAEAGRLLIPVSCAFLGVLSAWSVGEMLRHYLHR